MYGRVDLPGERCRKEMTYGMVTLNGVERLIPM
jgi:hypothetical protein